MTKPSRVRSGARSAVGVLAPRLLGPRPGRVCFASIPDYTDSAYWLYRHLLRTRTDLHITWLVKDRRSAADIENEFRDSGRSRHHTLAVVPWHSPTAYASYLRSSFVFHTHGAFGFSASRDGRTVVSLWHGMPLKVIGALDRDSGLWANGTSGDVHLATSRLFRPIVAAAFGVHPKAVLTSGLPRSDVLKGLVPPGADRSAIAAALDLDPERPIVLWLPTHRRDTDGHHGSFLDQVDTGVLETLVATASSTGCQIVVKLHPLDVLNDGGTGPLVDRGLTLVSADAWTSAGFQLYDALAGVDGLLTDISSVLVDFLHTRRPIGVIGFDESTYGRDVVFPMAPLSTSAVITSLDDADSIGTFLDRVARRSSVELPDDDIARWMNEDWTVHSSEALLQEVGL